MHFFCAIMAVLYRLQKKGGLETMLVSWLIGATALYCGATAAEIYLRWR